MLQTLNITGNRKVVNTKKINILMTLLIAVEIYFIYLNYHQTIKFEIFSNYKHILNLEYVKNENNIPKLRCLDNGWPEKGSKVLWPFYYYPNFPSLHDIFEDNGYLKVILSTHLTETHPRFKDRIHIYHKSNWSLYFHENNETENRNVVVNKEGIKTTPVFDPEFQIIKLIFKIPQEYQNKYNFVTIQRVLDDKKPNIYRKINENEPLYQPKYFIGQEEIQGGILRKKIFMEMPNNSKNLDDLSYRNVPFCQIKDKYSFYVNPIPKKKSDNSKDQLFLSENGQTKDLLRICTQNRIFDQKEQNEIVFRWVLYHIEQGFVKPIIYINKIDESEELSLPHYKKLIEQNLVEMIYYVFPYSFFFHEQFSQEISCIERNKDRTIWLGHNDVDERFFNTETNETIFEYMKKFTENNDVNDIGALLTPNEWMERFENDTTFTDNGNREYFAKAKNIIMPDNVEFYYVHKIYRGKKTIKQDAIVNAHFKDIKSGVVQFKNKNISLKMTEINQRLTKKIKKLLI